MTFRAWVTAVVLASAMLVACTGLPAPTSTSGLSVVSTATSSPVAPALRIGMLPIADTGPFYVAEVEGYFAEAGVAVELVPVASAAERDQLLITGRIDGAVSDLIAVALFNAEEPRIRIVRKARQAFSDSAQFSIMVPEDSGITSVGDLAGVEIAVSENSVIQYVTERLLQLEGLDPEDIRTINVPKIPVRFQLLEQGQVQAATLPDPLSSLAQLQGARVILDDSSHPEISQSVIVFRVPVIEERPEAVRRVMAAYERAVAAIADRPEAYHNLLVEQGRVPDALRDQYRFPRLPEPSVPTPEEWQDAVEWAMGAGLLKAPVAYEAAVDGVFVN